MTLDPGWMDSLKVPELFLFVTCVYLVRNALVAVSGSGVCPRHCVHDAGPKTDEALPMGQVAWANGSATLAATIAAVAISIFTFIQVNRLSVLGL
jgi:hypothetical protein